MIQVDALRAKHNAINIKLVNVADDNIIQTLCMSNLTFEHNHNCFVTTGGATQPQD